MIDSLLFRIGKFVIRLEIIVIFKLFLIDFLIV